MEPTKVKVKWAIASLAAVLVVAFGCLICIKLTTPATCAEVDISTKVSTTEFTEQVNDTQVAVEEAQAEQIAAAEAAEAAARAAASKSSSGSSYSSGGEGVLTESGGVNYFNGRRETWYSQKVLPGGGLDIPGRHVNAEDGTIRDADGYICVAASDLPKGTIVETSLGTGKVYDTGCAPGTTDIYTDWG